MDGLETTYEDSVAVEFIDCGVSIWCFRFDFQLATVMVHLKTDS